MSESESGCDWGPNLKKVDKPMVKGRCAQCQIFVVQEEIDRLILSGWKSLEDTHPMVGDIVPMLCPDCRRNPKVRSKP